jgi:uncharacterized protein (DUF2141 family)
MIACVRSDHARNDAAPDKAPTDCSESDLSIQIDQPTSVEALPATDARLPAPPPLSTEPTLLPPNPLAPALTNAIEGINFDENAINGGFYNIPPDPYGAAGPNHVVSVVNTSIEWHTKAGVQQNSQSLKTFFASLAPLTNTFDPKALYDQYNSRFVVVTLERTNTAQGAAANTSRIFIAVSDDDDPNGPWYFHQINAFETINIFDSWADYPGFAVDNQAIYITANMFDFGSGIFRGQRLWIIGKTPFYSGGAASSNRYDPFTAVGLPSLASTAQPAHMFETAPGGVGTFLVYYSGLNVADNELIGVIRVDNPLAAPAFTNQFVVLGDIDNISALMPDAPQLGTAQLIDSGDRRALNAVWRDNALWVAFTVVPPSGIDSGQATAHWVRVNTANLSALTLADQGDVGGEDIASGAYTYYPSVMVDANGNMGIGFAASAPSTYAGAYYTGRRPADAAGTVQTTVTMAAGQDYYYRAFGGARNRWGDYSSVALDPTTELTFWVFNEYALTRGTILGSYPGQDGRWGARFGSFAFDLPTLSISITPSAVAEHAGSGVVTGTVTRANTSTASALTVNLASSDTGEATVPASVTIPVSQATITFPITAVDDGLSDGTQIITITASATGYISGSAQLEVVDTSTFTLGGQVFVDQNGDGTLAITDTGLAGWTIFLDANANDIFDAGETSTTTSASGIYTFTVSSGTYRVRQLVESGWGQTTADPPPINVTGNQSDVDFGNFQLGAISGTVFRDTNGDGIRDADDEGLAGLTAYIDANRDNLRAAAEQVAATSSAGAYTFTDLAPGVYTVRVVLPQNERQSTPDPDDIPIERSGQVFSAVDFGSAMPKIFVPMVVR